MGAKHDQEIAEVEAFLRQEKRLARLEGDGYPIWGTAWDHELGAVWPIEDDLGQVVAQLRFSCFRAFPRDPSIVLLYRNRPIWRVDIVENQVTKPNPPWAADIPGLMPLVTGSHEHAWPDNCEHIRTGEKWVLPARREIQLQIRKMSQALPWFLDRIKLRFDPDQRDFDIPPQAELDLYK